VADGSSVPVAGVVLANRPSDCLGVEVGIRVPELLDDQRVAEPLLVVTLGFDDVDLIDRVRGDGAGHQSDDCVSAVDPEWVPAWDLGAVLQDHHVTARPHRGGGHNNEDCNEPSAKAAHLKASIDRPIIASVTYPRRSAKIRRLCLSLTA
jgi:hypothetical protein